MKDLKEVYWASSKEHAEYNLLKLEEKWGEKYPMVIKLGAFEPLFSIFWGYPEAYLYDKSY